MPDRFSHTDFCCNILADRFPDRFSKTDFRRRILADRFSHTLVQIFAAIFWQTDFYGQNSGIFSQLLTDRFTQTYFGRPILAGIFLQEDFKRFLLKYFGRQILWTEFWYFFTTINRQISAEVFWQTDFHIQILLQYFGRQILADRFWQTDFDRQIFAERFVL